MLRLITFVLAVATATHGLETIQSKAFYGYQYTCKFELGGGSDYKKLGNYKQQVCLDKCMLQKKHDNAINGIGVYTDQDKAGCWCLKKMPNRNGYKMFKSCAFQEDATETITLGGNAFQGAGVKCAFKPGGGSSFQWAGNYKQEDCLGVCLKKKGSDSAINGIGVYADQLKGGCWCLKNMPNRNHYRMFKSCVMQTGSVIQTPAPKTEHPDNLRPSNPPATTAASNAFTNGGICSRKFKKIGCYERDWSKVPHLLITDLDPTHKNHSQEMDWADYNKGLHSIACRCLKIAVGHYKYFAIGFNGECVAGKDHEELEEMFRVSSEDKSGCINGDWEQCDKNHHTECVGNVDFDFFYEVL